MNKLHNWKLNLNRKREFYMYKWLYELGSRGMHKIDISIEGNFCRVYCNDGIPKEKCDKMWEYICGNYGEEEYWEDGERPCCVSECV